mmetsp:Transcript_3180/g.7817  ORF Transcript_3180/g.7817 Transcript_3180/m.7817 type:complete len:232 (+) Transcript_3180:1844-2539(+)
MYMRSPCSVTGGGGGSSSSSLLRGDSISGNFESEIRRSGFDGGCRSTPGEEVRGEELEGDRSRWRPVAGTIIYFPRCSNFTFWTLDGKAAVVRVRSMQNSADAQVFERSRDLPRVLHQRPASLLCLRPRPRSDGQSGKFLQDVFLAGRAVQLLPEGLRVQPRSEHLNQQQVHQPHAEPNAYTCQGTARHIVPFANLRYWPDQGGPRHRNAHKKKQGLDGRTCHANVINHRL